MLMSATAQTPWSNQDWALGSFHSSVAAGGQQWVRKKYKKSNVSSGVVNLPIWHPTELFSTDGEGHITQAACLAHDGCIGMIVEWFK